MKYTFEIPGVIFLRNKKYYLNLNVYRNLNRYLLGELKHEFEFTMTVLYPQTNFSADKIRIKYKVTANSKRLRDLNNAWVIVDKFFCDWLVHRRVIKDDTVEQVFYDAPEFCGVDKTLPHNIVTAEVEVL